MCPNPSRRRTLLGAFSFLCQLTRDVSGSLPCLYLQVSVAIINEGFHA